MTMVRSSTSSSAVRFPAGEPIDSPLNSRRSMHALIVNFCS